MNECLSDVALRMAVPTDALQTRLKKHVPNEEEFTHALIGMESAMITLQREGLWYLMSPAERETALDAVFESFNIVKGETPRTPDDFDDAFVDAFCGVKPDHPLSFQRQEFEHSFSEPII
jgi:hypothetical protein